MLGTAPTLRSAAISCRLQPTLFTPCTYSTTSSPSPLQPKESSTISRRRAPIARHDVAFRSTKPSIRHASSISSPSPTFPSGSDVSTQEKLDWNTFFKLRKVRRRYQLGSCIGTSIGGLALGVQVLLRTDMDAIVSQFPLDPFITLGLITFTCGGVGWLAGPIVGTSLFNLRNRKFKGQMDEKEKEFYRRVKRYRVDPSASSMANPVPDYYGEKISSVSGYRQWLKDQRAFNKKRTTYIKY